MTKARVLTASALMACGGALLMPQVASAHINTVSCQSPGLWLIVNSEAGLSQTFTTNQGHSGSIAAGGSTTVSFSGTSLTVFGTWSDGATNSATGTGDCTVVTTAPPTTPPPTTAPPTTAPPTTEAPTTTAPGTTEAPTTTETPSTTDGPTTTAPGTTEPGTTLAPTTTLVGGDSGERDPDPERPTLPATGSDSSASAVIGGTLVLLGGAALVVGRRKAAAG